ncbi:MAG: penicillin acylase family protein, partial [Meiothermus sp.]
MRRLLRFLGRLLLFAVVLVVLAGGVGWLWLRGATLPQHSGRLALKGLMAPVEVLREPGGVVHLKAQSEEDLFFALGVVHAQDRLWQMEFQRRVGAGRLSEVVGAATLSQDKFLRTWGFYRAAEQGYAGLSPEGKAIVDAYVAGINAYLQTNPPLPLEYRLLGFRPEPWKPADVLVWAKMMAYD